MKYWVYKESRILGPFDKEAVSGLPGLDSGTLVCAGDPSASSWVPAGELADLTGIAASGSGGVLDDFPSSGSLLDQLQIDSSGLLSDDEFPGSVGEELFQDSTFKKEFRDILTDRISPDETSARHAREKISELTSQLEAMYRHVSELEAGQTDLARRLASKELELRSRAPVVPPELPSSAPAVPGAEAVKTFLSPAPPPIPGGPPPVAAVAVPPPAEPSSEWPEVPAAGPAAFPSFAGGAPLPPMAELPAAASTPAAPALPDMPSFASAGAPPAPAAELPSAASPEPPAPAPAAAPKAFSFGKSKSFKIVPTVKSFKVVGAEDVAPAASTNPVAEFKVDPIETPAPVAAAIPAPPPPPPPAAAAPVVLAPIVPPPVTLAPAPVPVPLAAPVPTPEPAPITNPFSLPARPEPAPIPVPAPLTPMSPPPNTLSRSQPVPDLTSADLGASADATAQMPPATMARSGAVADPAAAAARFAKPEPPPPTGEIKKPARNNKAFLIGGAVLVIVLVILGVIFMRQPKDDLKQMATLDDGKAPIGLPADDTSAPPPIVKPKIATPPPVAPPPAAPPGPSAEHAAAIDAVKNFPLDGDRGTVGRWLQYSYTASPGAGTEEWNASTTGDNTVLVEYRLVPGAAGGKGALYLFEVDPNGIVLGKNIEARQMLAGGPPPEAPKPKKKAPAKKAAPKKRRVIHEEPKEVPLLPLPDSGELRPPAEDNGSFGSDTVNSGI